MSLLPLYEGETLMPQSYAAMTAKGFDRWGSGTSFPDPSTGRLLQIDAIFTTSSFDPSTLTRKSHTLRRAKSPTSN